MQHHLDDPNFACSSGMGWDFRSSFALRFNAEASGWSALSSIAGIPLSLLVPPV